LAGCMPEERSQKPEKNHVPFAADGSPAAAVRPCLHGLVAPGRHNACGSFLVGRRAMRDPGG
jgi:hypothetical protein